MKLILLQKKKKIGPKFSTTINQPKISNISIIKSNDWQIYFLKIAKVFLEWNLLNIFNIFFKLFAHSTNESMK